VRKDHWRSSASPKTRRLGQGSMGTLRILNTLMTRCRSIVHGPNMQCSPSLTWNSSFSSVGARRIHGGESSRTRGSAIRQRIPRSSKPLPKFERGRRLRPGVTFSAMYLSWDRSRDAEGPCPRAEKNPRGACKTGAIHRQTLRTSWNSCARCDGPGQPGLSEPGGHIRLAQPRARRDVAPEGKPDRREGGG